VNTTVVLFTCVLAWCATIVAGATTAAASAHSPGSRFPTYDGRVMCGYQGWFRAPDDGAAEGWGHYAAKGKFDAEHVHVDFWPDVSEYEKTYETALANRDGTPARVFSSRDASTVDLHFKWMEQYGIDGVFVQRFFGGLRTEQGRRRSRVVLEHALAASRKHGRALAVMYDLSGLRSHGEDCSAVIADWKELVDQLKITSQGTDQTYLYHRGKPLVAIWGLGFPDRPYDLRDVGIDRLIDFLKNDPTYGGCSVMLGVPNYFRDLDVDCRPDPYLHELLAKADVVMPWTVQRFTPLLHADAARYAAQVKADVAWCSARKLDYAACATPGFSWCNLGKVEFGGGPPLNQIPRLKGAFYWSQIDGAVRSGAKMLYVAMFDEMDEGTAIFKCTNEPPVGPQLCTYEGAPSDHYLWLTGEAGRLLRGERPLGALPAAGNVPKREVRR
jgi:hypothetical protein